MLLSTMTNEEIERVKAIVAPSTDISDEDIIVHISQGNHEAYGSIMRRYNQRMFRIARSILLNDAAAMDVVQEAHIKAFINLNSFKGPSTFVAWLYAITRNEALMHLRKHKREVVMSNDDIHLIQNENKSTYHKQPELSVHENPESYLENKQLQKLINSHIDSLSEKFRVVFVLRAIEQLSVKETAQILEVNEITVKTRYFRAKRLIRQKIQSSLDAAGMNIYEFGGEHCDQIVLNVLNYIDRYNF